MVGIAAAAAIAVAAVVAVGAAVAAGISAHAATQAAEANAEAQKYVAEQNAKATIEAAKLAADAQRASAMYDMQARTHESDVAFQTDLEYIKQDKWAAERENSTENFYRNTQMEIDAIDFQYGEEGEWGIGAESSYDYGYEDGGGALYEYS